MTRLDKTHVGTLAGRPHEGERRPCRLYVGDEDAAVRIGEELVDGASAVGGAGGSSDHYGAPVGEMLGERLDDLMVVREHQDLLVVPGILQEIVDIFGSRQRLGDAEMAADAHDMFVATGTSAVEISEKVFVREAFRHCREAHESREFRREWHNVIAYRR